MLVQNRIDFVDWLKALGMLLIVFGHFFGDPFSQFTQPIYFKQLGVAFFVFIMGWGLAREKRPHWQVVFNRLFPMYFWGIVIALVISVIFYLSQERLLLSNYSPFIVGFNVLFDFFPANPTTWFIGTYLHILLLWAVLLRRIEINLFLLLSVFVLEWLIRAILIDAELLFNAYMLTSNWLGVLTLGMYMKQQIDVRNTRSNLIPACYLAVLWAVYFTIWAWLMNPLGLDHSFPFRQIPSFSASFNAASVSAAISLLYISHTLFAVKLFSYIPANAVVRFFSRNTLVIFIGHMPLYSLAAPIASYFVPSGWGQRAIIVIIMYVGLALLSELLHRIINLHKLKVWLWLKMTAWQFSFSR